MGRNRCRLSAHLGQAPGASVGACKPGVEFAAVVPIPLRARHSQIGPQGPSVPRCNSAQNWVGKQMDTGVIDRFTELFTGYIDSGFGLLSGEVAFVASTLIV